MEVVSLNSTNYIGLTSVYPHDSAVSINQNIYYTEDGLEIPLVQAYNKLSDNTINNFSSLFLTSRIPILSALTINSLESYKDEGFTTYLASNAPRGITGASRFLVVQEPNITVNAAACNMTGTVDKIDNTYMFDVQFLTDKLCKIYHENDNIKRYMTVNLSGVISFVKDTNTDYLGDMSPQIFYYVYDKDNDYIVILKNVNDIVKYVIYNPLALNITLGDPLTASDIPYKSQAIFKCSPRSEISADTKLYDPWVSYDQDFKTNTQKINLNRSYSQLQGNLLFNSEFYNVTGSEIPVNILSLKNTNTPENLQSRGNPFQSNRSSQFLETEVEMREYKKLFTGSNQKLGNDNITAGYEAYNTDIIFKGDKITYFHIPQIFYPYLQLNINDSGLVEAGAIASDHPLKSDKVFKKLGSFKYTSPFGEVRDEATGNFLCSWLSGNNDPAAKPVWLDRYYNPSKLSFLEALTSNPIQTIYYTTVSECLFSEIQSILGDVDVFDKPSDLIFEPGCYYAYHHYGPNDVQKYISSLDMFLVQKDFNIYNNTLGTPVLPNNAMPDEYIFNGDRYATSSQLSSIQDSGQFTMSFWAHTSDWSVPFGDQIIGNYTNDGFGIFNQNITTPTLYINTITGAHILNTDLKELKKIVYDSQITAIIRYDNITNYNIIFKDGTIKEYNNIDAEIRSSYIEEFSRYTYHDYTPEEIYVLVSNATVPVRQVYRVKRADMSISEYTSLMLSQGNYYTASDDYFPDWLPTESKSTKFLKATTVDIYNSNLFFTPGTKSRRIGNAIYYMQYNDRIIKWSNIDDFTTAPVTTAFKTQNSKIRDFNIDFENNIWVITDDNRYYKFTTDRELLLSGTATNGVYKNYKIGFIADFVDGAYMTQPLLIQEGITPVPTNPWGIYNYDIEGTVPPPSAMQLGTFTDENLNTLESNIFIPLSAPAYSIFLLGKNGELLSNSLVLGTTGLTLDPTNSDFLRKNLSEKYNSPNLNIKTTMTNVFDTTQTLTIDMPYNLSGLDPGYHHFAIRVDTYYGNITVFIDGRKVANQQFEPRRYQFNNFNKRPFLAGTSNYTNSIPLFKFLKKKCSLVTGLTIKDFYLFNRAIKDSDVQMLARENMVIHDVVFTMPCGRRNYLEEIERHFKASVPGTKSTRYNIVIKNSGISDNSLRSELEKRMIEQLSELAPVYSKLNTIKWIN